jgi:iron(III) transport system ATP-binding protein
MAQLLRQIGTTAVYVTHDRREAEWLADRIVHLAAGNVESERTVTSSSGEIA